VDRLVTDLSRSFTRQGERVLILDARIANAQQDSLPALVERRADGGPLEVAAAADGEAPGLAGLAQYLVFEGQQCESFLYHTRLPEVDYLPSGGPYPITDALAAEPMADLLKTLKQRYTMILILGPAFARSMDTEILTAFVDGVVVFLNEPLGTFTAADEEFFQSLREKQAPLLGSFIAV
jgi:hypothetical protein